jgi:hypothetical protein
VLADADAARVSFLVTADVDDFAEVDLAALRLSAVHPDLFMALRFPCHACLRALDLLVANMKNPPRTAAEIYGLIARQHPRLFSAHSDAHEGLRPVDPVHAEPSVTVRGPRCVLCESVADSPGDLRIGLCVDCSPDRAKPDLLADIGARLIKLPTNPAAWHFHLLSNYRSLPGGRRTPQMLRR